MSERAFLQQAIVIAKHNFVPDPVTGVQKGGPFGAMVVKDGRVLGQSGNSVTSTFDPTAHAEINAIRAAAAACGAASLVGATVVTSCEPCPMCLGGIESSGIDRVVQAATRYMAAAGGFDDEEFYKQLELAPERRDHPMLAISNSDTHFLMTTDGRAKLAKHSAVSAVVLRGTEIVGVGRDERDARQDPTAHSVVGAIQAAGKMLGNFDLSGCELITASPLDRLCAGASMWSRVDRTLYAATNEAAHKLRLSVDSNEIAKSAAITPIQASGPNANAPFEAWLAQVGRTLY